MTALLALIIIAALFAVLWAAACGTFDLCDPDDDWTPTR